MKNEILNLNEDNNKKQNKIKKKDNIVIVKNEVNLIIIDKKNFFPPKKTKKQIFIRRNYKTELESKKTLEDLKMNNKEMNFKISDIDNNDLAKKKTFVNSNISIYSKNIFNVNGNKEIPDIFNFVSINEVNKVKRQFKNLSDYELKNLEYEEALKFDKRTFIQIYFANLKRENIIIFTFFQCKDYNLLYIKLARFIFILATDMAMNAFFFSDESMHKLFLT